MRTGHKTPLAAAAPSALPWQMICLLVAHGNFRFFRSAALRFIQEETTGPQQQQRLETKPPPLLGLDRCPQSSTIELWRTHLINLPLLHTWKLPIQHRSIILLFSLFVFSLPPSEYRTPTPCYSCVVYSIANQQAPSSFHFLVWTPSQPASIVRIANRKSTFA